MVARFATAMHKGDAAELAAVSEVFDEMGDCVTAVDAAAQAALAYRRQDLRGSALGCAARAEALASIFRGLVGHCGFCRVFVVGVVGVGGPRRCLAGSPGPG